MSLTQPSAVEFMALLKSSNKVIVKFYADWCESCKLFAPVYISLSKDEHFADITFIDVNAETNPEARAMAGASTLPFFATFKNGELVEGIATARKETVIGLLSRLHA